MSGDPSVVVTLLALGSAAFTIFLGQDPVNRAVLTFAGAAASTMAAQQGVAAALLLLIGAMAAFVHHQLPFRSPALAAFAAAAPLLFVDQTEVPTLMLIAVLFGGRFFEWYARQPIDLAALGQASPARATPLDAIPAGAGASREVPHADPPALQAAQASPGTTLTALRPVEVSLGSPGEFVTIGASPRLLRSSDAKLPHAAIMTTTAHAYDGYEHEDYVIRAASHIGTKHMAGGGPRQDSVALSRTSDGRYIVAAVADGVGSAKHSAIGSEWAARTAIRLVVHRYDSTSDLPDGAHIARIASDMVKRVATTLLGDGIDPNDFSTTLVLSVIDTASGRALVYRVGDSGASVRQREGWHHCFEDSGDVEASTNALPAEEPSVENWVGAIAPGECLMLMTDGVGDLLHHAPDVGSALHHLTAEPGTASDFSSIVGFQRQQAHDDQSAIGIWRMQATP